MLYIDLICGVSLNTPIEFAYYNSLCSNCPEPITFETNAGEYSGVSFWIKWEEYGEEVVQPILDAKMPQEDRIEKFYFQVRYDGSCAPITDEFNVTAIIRCGEEFKAIRLDDFRICVTKQED